jgi:hypothetical protein
LNFVHWNVFGFKWEEVKGTGEKYIEKGFIYIGKSLPWPGLEAGSPWLNYFTFNKSCHVTNMEGTREEIKSWLNCGDVSHIAVHSILSSHLFQRMYRIKYREVCMCYIWLFNREKRNSPEYWGRIL